MSRYYYDYYVSYNQHGAPTKPRKRKITRYKKVDWVKSVKSKNFKIISDACQKILDDNPGLEAKDLFISTGYYSSGTITYSLPESDADFKKRVEANDKDYEDVLKQYEKARKEYEKEKKARDLANINDAVKGHEAAINTIAEVLQKYPDVLDKAVAKAVKGK
jgi:hypothetical protein